MMQSQSRYMQVAISTGIGWEQSARGGWQRTDADVAPAARLDAVEALLGGRPSRGVRVHAVVYQLAQVLHDVTTAGSLSGLPGKSCEPYSAAPTTWEHEVHTRVLLLVKPQRQPCTRAHQQITRMHLDAPRFEPGMHTLGQSAPGMRAVRRPRVGISPVTISHRMTPNEYISTCKDNMHALILLLMTPPQQERSHSG